MDCCNHCHSSDPHRGNPSYRRVLCTVLAINAAMFLVEIGAGLAAGSASLQADALDFFGDAANYAISLLVVGMALRYAPMLTIRSRGRLANRARRYSTNGASGFTSLKPAVTSEFSMISRGHGDCRSSSTRMALAYSLQGLKSRPNE
jgi:hypothetical protein